MFYLLFYFSLCFWFILFFLQDCLLFFFEFRIFLAQFLNVLTFTLFFLFFLRLSLFIFVFPFVSPNFLPFNLAFMKGRIESKDFYFVGKVRTFDSSSLSLFFSLICNEDSFIDRFLLLYFFLFFHNKCWRYELILSEFN